MAYSVDFSITVKPSQGKVILAFSQQPTWKTRRSLLIWSPPFGMGDSARSTPLHTVTKTHCISCRADLPFSSRNLTKFGTFKVSMAGVYGCPMLLRWPLEIGLQCKLFEKIAT